MIRGEYTSPYGSKKWEYLAIFSCTLLMLCIGTMIGWTSPIVVLLLSPDSPIYNPNLEISTLAAFIGAGHMISNPIHMLITDRIGRKKTILFGGFPLVACWSIILMTTSGFMWYVARTLSGISLGLGVLVIPIYLGEISSIKTRGANGTMMTIMCNTGILMSFILVPRFSLTTTTGIFLSASICFVVLFSFMPESPYYLAMRGRTEEAEETLKRIRGRIDVSAELTIIDEFVKNEERKKFKLLTALRDIFMIKRHRRAFFIIFLLSLNNYFSSSMPLIVYGQLIFKDIAKEVSHYTINVIAGITLLLSSIITSFFVDRLGRKKLIIGSTVIVGSCNLTTSSYFYAKDYFNIDVSSYYLIPAIASILAIFFNNVGFCTILSIMMSEVFAIEVKVLSSCILGIIAGLLSVINDKLYIYLAISLNYGHALPFVLFCIFICINTTLLYYLAPETKGKTFLEIQRELQD